MIELTDMSDFYVEFEIASQERYQQLEAVITALAEAKRTNSFRDDAYWLSFFDDEARSHFWWPTEEELEAYQQRWDTTPYQERLSDPQLMDLPWDFGSMIDAFQNGEYELLGCHRLSERVGQLEYEPFAWPFGGTDCMRALIEAFGHRVTGETEI